MEGEGAIPKCPTCHKNADVVAMRETAAETTIPGGIPVWRCRTCMVEWPRKE